MEDGPGRFQAPCGQEMEEELASILPQVEIQKLQGKLESRFPQIVRLESKDDRGRPVYSWTNQGKSSYQRQAEEFSREPRTSQTLKIAGDGIERAAGHLVQDHQYYFACCWE